MPLLLCALLLLLSGCLASPLPPQEPPSVPLPQQWRAAAAAQTGHPESDWWHNFHSVNLDRLLTRAVNHSPDFALTLERVIQAEIQLRNSGASLFPSLNLSGSTSRRYSRTSGGDSTTGSATGLSLGASYEIDLFGRIAAEIDAAQATFAASSYDAEAVRLSLLSGIAAAYFQQVATRERLTIARANLDITERVLAIVETRLRFGSAAQLDYDRQLATLLGQRSNILTLEEQSRQQFSALAVLVGLSADQLSLAEESLDALQVPVVTPYLPAAILLRRPDLARAEAQLAAARANISVARKALFPTVQLTGSLGGASTALLSLSDPVTSASLAAGLSQAIFDGGRRRNQVATASSRQRETLENYRKAVLTSLKEVEDALDRVHSSAERRQLQEDIVRLAQSNLTRAEFRYREGADELLTLLDTQRSLFQARDQQIQLQLARLNAALDLYKALGGGWHKPRPQTLSD